MTDDSLSKTLIIPNPGGRRKQGMPTSEHMPQPPSEGQFQPPPIPQNPLHNSSEICFLEGENKILSYSREILILASNIRSLEPTNTIEQLRGEIEKLITTFDQKLADSGSSKEISLTARYILCCLLDELVLSTPWGAESSWSEQTLLGKYHNETFGGEKFFLIVNKLAEQPQRNLDLIELCYVCISAGFCGKYKISERGEQELLRISQQLYQFIEQSRPISRDLSPAWQGVGKQEKNFVKRFPSWIIFLVMGFILLTVYIGFLSSLKAKVEPIYQKLESVGWQDFVLKINKSQPKEVDVNSIAKSLSEILDKEISNKIVAIDVRDNMLVIRLISTSLFKSGSSFVNEEALPDVNKLVNAIKDYANSVLVIGHTDSTGKADSNWIISRKRAEAIASWLGKSNVQLSNTITRGVADTQPLRDDIDNEYNRSLNRRVELVLVLKG